MAYVSPILAAVLVVLFFTLAFPRVTSAAFGAADTYCATACLPFWMKKPKPMPCTLTCEDTTNTGVTTGKCNPMPPGKCIGTGFNNTQGDMKGMGDMSKFLEQAMGMLKDLMKGGQKGGGGGQQGGGTGANPSSLYPTCVRNTATNTVSPIPCTETNGTINYGTSAGVSGSSGTIGGNTSDILLNALNGESGATGSTTNANTNSNTNSTTNTSTSGTQATTTSTVLIQGAQGGVQPSSQLSQQQGMLQGDIVVGGSGGMLYVRSRDPQNNTEVAGFFGGNTMGQSQSSSLIGRMCGTRPWSGGLLGGLIAPTFFDGLCQRFGYQVGVIPVTSAGSANTAPRKPTITITQSPTASTSKTSPAAPQPEVDIWANPSSVRLGARTYIFWNTRDVESCIASGPSFSHNTPSGGASTVPLSDTSTFTIECKTTDGQTVRDSVRVNLAL